MLFIEPFDHVGEHDDLLFQHEGGARHSKYVHGVSPIRAAVAGGELVGCSHAP